MSPKKTPSKTPSPAPKSPAPPQIVARTPATLVNVTLPLHYAAIVQRSLEQSLTARGHEGARMLVTILDAFAAAVGDYALPEEVTKNDEPAAE
jgi:hypothetical protein